MGEPEQEEPLPCRVGDLGAWRRKPLQPRSQGRLQDPRRSGPSRLLEGGHREAFGARLPRRLEQQQGAFAAEQGPWEVRAFSESERSGRGARPRRGPGGLRRRLRLGAVLSRGR